MEAYTWKHSLYEKLSSHFIGDVDHTPWHTRKFEPCLLCCSEKFELQHTSAEHGSGWRPHIWPAPATTLRGHSEDTGEISRWSDIQGELIWEGSELIEVPIHIAGWPRLKYGRWCYDFFRNKPITNIILSHWRKKNLRIWTRTFWTLVRHSSTEPLLLWVYHIPV